MAYMHATGSLVSGLLILLSLTACRSAALPSSEAPRPTAGSSAVSARDVTARLLTVWTVSALEAVDEEAPSLRRTIADRGGSLPTMAAEIAVVTKPAYGEAGIAAFLRSTAHVAPDRLPDLCILPLELLAGLRDEGLIQPIADPLLEGRAADAFPFAMRLTGDGKTLWALPLAVDLLHAIGRDVPVPGRWQDLPSGAPMVMPLGGAATPPELAPLLALYGAAGGDVAALPVVDAAAARSGFALLAAGLATGRIGLPQEGRSPRSAWNSFAAAQPPGAVVSSGAVIDHQADYPGMSWAALPGPDGPAAPLAWGWAVALTAREPTRAAAAVELLQVLTAPEHTADLLSAGLLPAQRDRWAARVTDALDRAPTPDYLSFVQGQLEQARGLGGIEHWGAAWAAASQVLADGGESGAALARLNAAAVP